MSRELLIFIFVMFSIFSVCESLSVQFYQKYENCIFCFSIVLLALVAGFREATYDYESYVVLFQQTPSFFDMLLSGDFSYIMDIREEPGFMLLNALVKCFSDEPVVMFCVTSFIVLFLYGISIRKYTEYPMLALLFYFSMIFMVKEMVQIRHGIGIAIFLYSFRYIYVNNFRIFFLFIMLATCFHGTMVFALLVYPFRKIKMNYSAGLFVLFLCVSLFVVNLIDNLLFPLSEGFSYYARLAAYFGSDYLSEADLTRFWKYSFLFIVFFSLGRWLREKYAHYDFMMVVLGVGLIITAMWNAYPFFADRLSAAMWMSLIFLLPSVLCVSSHYLWRYVMVLSMLAIAYNSFANNIVMVCK